MHVGSVMLCDMWQTSGKWRGEVGRQVLHSKSINRTLRKKEQNIIHKSEFLERKEKES